MPAISPRVTCGSRLGEARARVDLEGTIHVRHVQEARRLLRESIAKVIDNSAPQSDLLHSVPFSSHAPAGRPR